MKADKGTRSGYRRPAPIIAKIIGTKNRSKPKTRAMPLSTKSPAAPARLSKDKAKIAPTAKNNTAIMPIFVSGSKSKNGSLVLLLRRFFLRLYFRAISGAILTFYA